MQVFHRKQSGSHVQKSSISWPIERNRSFSFDMASHKELPNLPREPEPVAVLPSLSSGSGSSRVSSSLSSHDGRYLPRRSSSAQYCHQSCLSSESLSSAVEPSYVSPDKIPSQETMDMAGDVPIFDSEGNSRPFRSLYEGPLAIGEQQLIIFVRHFFCGACQSYLKALSHAISLQTYFTLPTPTSIVIVGLGNPNLIPAYRSFTGTPFPLFTDPSRRLHKLLGMGWSLNLGRRPKYHNHVNEVEWITGQVKQFRNLKERELRFKGGGVFWIGGEFLIRDGKMVWCHRMKNYRDHAEMDVVKKLLNVEG